MTTPTSDQPCAEVEKAVHDKKDEEDITDLQSHVTESISPSSSSNVMDGIDPAYSSEQQDEDDREPGEDEAVEEIVSSEEDPLDISQRPIVLDKKPPDAVVTLEQKEEGNNPENASQQPILLEYPHKNPMISGESKNEVSEDTTTFVEKETPHLKFPEGEKTDEPTIESLQSQIKAILIEKADVEKANLELIDKLSSSSVQISGARDSAMMASELQKSLQDQMTHRAEVEDTLRMKEKDIAALNTKISELEVIEKKYAELQDSVSQVTEERRKAEEECKKLRSERDNYVSKEVVLSNRLNDAKKKEANVQNAAGKLESVNEALTKELEEAKAELTTLRLGKEKHDLTLEKLKKKCVERVKLTEGALVEERNLNEERKKKMKVFVETKAEELRNAKSSNDELRKNLDETQGALSSVRGKLEDLTMQHEKLIVRNREILRDMNRMKKNSEQLHQMGDNLELELHKSAQETEEHKNKRLTAKHELMTVLRKLEAEQTVSNKLRDSVKFTFTPKALSQQQLLTESLENFESLLETLARRLGKPTPVVGLTSKVEEERENLMQGSSENERSTRNGHPENSVSTARRGTRSELDTYRLLSNLENETQHVSKGILAFQSAVETLQVLLDDSNEKTCASALNDFFTALNAARGQPTNSTNGISTTAVRRDVPEDEEDGFAGVTPSPKNGSERFGLVSGS